MASEVESFLALVHCSGKIKKCKTYGVKFTDREPLSVFISSSSTLSDLKNSILQKFGVFGSK
ncbi:Putative mutator sub-class protein [Arachis hypogaea]|nr:Putative mutator sub-class protein [Arachis hypogaea]